MVSQIGNDKFLMVGDFNIPIKDSIQYDLLIKLLGVTDTKPISKIKVTCDAVSNELSNNEDSKKETVLDYILLKDNTNTISIKNLKYKEVRKGGQVLSDHNLIEAQLIIK